MTELSPKPVTFILVPGAGGQAWYWHRVVAELEARGHTAVAVDLPAGDDTADLGVYADTIVDAAGGRDRVVLVAQSMGGFAAPLACDRLSVSLLVLAIERLGTTPDELPGGHLVALAQPVPLVDRLEAYAMEVVGSG
jgi:alpha-beta hydrolase superfamily lysophospholipase